MSLHAWIAAEPVSVLVTGGLLGALLLAFVVFFLAPGLRHLVRLAGLQRRVRSVKASSAATDFKKLFAVDRRLAHLWSEFQETLHRQTEVRDGVSKVIAVRATAPSETYFSSQYVVDSRLHTEFFKHLPGLFTGVGIIGTFSGLINGLHQFKVNDNADTVRASLESLMHSVGEAFLVSAAAIGAAMLVTFIEKFLLSDLYRRTEDIAQAIDACFDAGAGEEYLARIVMASESSASQAKILKDALVNDLGALLRELTESQISAGRAQQAALADRFAELSQHQVTAAREDNAAMATTIAESIQSSLKQPLQDIASAVASASGDQSASATRMLQDVMTSFSQRLNDLFGGQISGLTELNQQTARSIQDAVGTLQALVEGIEQSSRRSTDAMAERMAEALEQMERRQSTMQGQSEAFIEQIRQLVASSQNETSQKLQSTLATIGDQVSTMLSTLAESQGQVFEGNRAREQAMAERSSSAVAAMSETVESAIAGLSEASSQMAQNVASLTHATLTSSEKMNTGAELLGAASRDFASAGERVTNVMDQAGSVASKLTEASGSLTSGAAALQQQLRDYQVHREAMSAMVGELRATVEAAKREASLSADILSRIEGSATRLGEAQTAATDYLENVSRVLADAHNSFATEVKRTLGIANNEFHTKLSTAVGLLNGAVEELEITLSAMGSLTPTKA